MAIWKLAFVLLISFLCSAKGRSVSVIGDVLIEVDNGKLRCDKIVCPLDTERCVVSKEKDPNDPTVLVRSNICYSANGEELANSLTNETIDPHTQISFLIEANRYGSISTVNSYNSFQSTSIGQFDKEAFNAGMETLNRSMVALNKGLSQMSHQLANMFGGI
ncbi:uncharacterized protein LOC142233338 [Haematobia irritans]|uniref:Putative secreted protein n=1 Tax=Haematobia irritans TaxID=7368 RepID=A0A1L8EFJ6_HAEIR